MIIRNYLYALVYLTDTIKPLIVAAIRDKANNDLLSEAITHFAFFCEMSNEKAALTDLLNDLTIAIKEHHLKNNEITIRHIVRSFNRLHNQLSVYHSLKDEWSLKVDLYGNVSVTELPVIESEETLTELIKLSLTDYYIGLKMDGDSDKPIKCLINSLEKIVNITKKDKENIIKTLELELSAYD